MKRVKRMWVLEILLRLVRVQDLETEIPWFLFLKKNMFFFLMLLFLMKGRLINYYIFLRKKKVYFS